MNKALILLAGLSLLFATSANASVARMTALGQDTEIGSYFIKDTRNIFHNPAYLNDLGGFVQFETGDSGTTGNDTATTNAQAQGGFFTKNGNFGYGVWLGNDSTTASSLRTLSAQGFDLDNDGTGETGGAGMGSTFLNPDNTTEFLFAGSGGIDWGASVSYSKNSETDTTANQEESSLAVRAGAKRNKWDVGVALALQNEASQVDGATEQSFTGKAGYQVVGGYDLNNGFKTVLLIKSSSGETDNGGTIAEITGNEFKLGVARKIDMDSGFFFWEAAYMSSDTEVSTAATTVKFNDTFLPLTFGVEGKATEWLTLRGSATQRFFINDTVADTGAGESTTFEKDTTTVAAGASLLFDKFTFDGVIASPTHGNTATDHLSFNNIASQVSMTYMF